MTDRLLGNPNILTQDAREILTDAARSLIDEWFQDAWGARGTGLDPESSMASSLPPKLRHGRDARFAKRFFGSLIVVVERLGDPTRGEPYLHCTAQELALYALTESAKEQAEAVGVDVDLDILREFVVEDTDIEMLWDMSLDGVEDSDADWDDPPVNLRFDRWFEPFGNAQDGWPDPFDDG